MIAFDEVLTRSHRCAIRRFMGEFQGHKHEEHRNKNQSGDQKNLVLPVMGLLTRYLINIHYKCEKT